MATTNGPPRLYIRGGDMKEAHAHLLAGGVLPMPDGLMAEPVGEPTPCKRCAGKGTEPDPKGEWLDPGPCMDCHGLLRTVEIRMVPDPMVVTPWVSAGRRGVRISARTTTTGEVAAHVENDTRSISATIRPAGSKAYRVTLEVEAVGERGQSAEQAWDIALRLADAELRHHGYILC